MKANDTSIPEWRIKIEKKWQKALFMSVASDLILHICYLILYSVTAGENDNASPNDLIILYVISAYLFAYVFLVLIGTYYIERIQAKGTKNTLKEMHSMTCIFAIIFLLAILAYGINSAEYKSVPTNIKILIGSVFTGTSAFFYFFWLKVPEKWRDAAYKYLYL